MGSDYKSKPTLKWNFKQTATELRHVWVIQYQNFILMQLDNHILISVMNYPIPASKKAPSEWRVDTMLVLIFLARQYQAVVTRAAESTCLENKLQNYLCW